MNYLWKVFITIALVAFFFYWQNQRQLEKELELIQTFTFAHAENMDQVIIKKLPEDQTYFSFKDEEINDVITALQSLTLQEIKRLDEKNPFLSIQLKTEESIHEFITYVFYDNGDISYTEGSLIGQKTLFYKSDLTALLQVRDQISEGKTFQ